MVGDTLADMGMGRSARLGATVGVLSGIGRREELRPQADHIVCYLIRVIQCFLIIDMLLTGQPCWRVVDNNRWEPRSC
jgi:hypothetical protein